VLAIERQSNRLSPSFDCNTVSQYLIASYILIHGKYLRYSEAEPGKIRKALFPKETK
jgi:hypothetical protein